MPAKRPPKDINELAKYIVDASTGEADKIEPPEKNPHAQALSKLGASKGGKARADKLSDRKKKQIAKKGAEARWAKYYEEKKD
jgi:hypothetical protein